MINFGNIVVKHKYLLLVSLTQLKNIRQNILLLALMVNYIGKNMGNDFSYQTTPINVAVNEPFTMVITD